MYQVTIKGRNLNELKKAVSDIHGELSSGKTVVKGMEKNLDRTEVNPEVTTAVKSIQENVVAPALGVTATPLAIVENNTVAQELGEADSTGVRWDSRIHNKGKTKTVKGIWKLTRGTDKDLAARLIAEQVAVAPVAAIPVAFTAPVVDTHSIALAQPVPLEPVVVAPVAALPVMSSSHTVETFIANFAMVIGSLISEGKVTQDYINQLMTHFAVDQIWKITDVQKAEMFAVFVQTGIISQVG